MAGSQVGHTQSDGTAGKTAGTSRVPSGPSGIHTLAQLGRCKLGLDKSDTRTFPRTTEVVRHLLIPAKKAQPRYSY